MPDFNPLEIGLILEVAAQKAGTTFTSNGLDQLSQTIDDHRKPQDDDIKPRYLKEKMFKQVQDALAEGANSVQLKQSKVDTLTNYIGFQHVEDFRQTWQQLDTLLEIQNGSDNDSKNDIFMICTALDQTTLQRSLNLLMDHSGMVIHTFHIASADLEAWKELFKDAFQKAIFGMLLLTPALLALCQTAPVKKLLADLFKTTKRWLPVWMDEKEHKNDSPIFGLPEELVLCGQAGLAIGANKIKHLGIDLDKAIGKQAKPPKTAPTINISDSGTIITGGNTKVKGKFISSRDMHITIEKKK